MNRTRGFSLVELMVAVTLALIVTAGVISVFVGARSAFQSTSGTAALSDSGRFALTFIENAVRDTGNMACGASIRTMIQVNPEPTPLNYTAGPGPLFLFQPMVGYEAAGTGVGTAYAGSVTPGALGNWNSPVGYPAGLDGAFGTLAALPVKNNDILVVHSSTRAAQPAYVTSATPTDLTLTTASPAWGGQLAIVSDCVKSILFQISGIAGPTISHATGGAPGNLANAFPASVTFAAGSQVTLMQTTAYYIGVGSDGDGALFSADLAADNTFTPANTNVNELVPDIEAMQILYGVDLNGTQTVSQYVTADQVTDFTTVMSVEVAVLAAGTLGSAARPAAAIPYNLFGTTVTAPLDTRARQVFAVTIAARNLLP